MISIPYTICFCIQGNSVLLIHRNFPPNKDLWNGIGGKIEPGEDKTKAVQREVMEEAGILLGEDIFEYVGIVTWSEVEDVVYSNKGMYAFIARLPEHTIDWKELDTREGLLAWKSLDFAQDKTNTEVVDNIPYFLPEMLKTTNPKEFHCVYKNMKFVNLKITNL